MGLLNRIANAVGEVGEKVFDYNLKKMAQEDELKMREEIEMNKEKRIYEQWEKQHALTRGEQLSDESRKRELDVGYELTKEQAAENRKIAEEGRKHQWETDPKNPDRQKDKAQIASWNANTNQSNAATSRYNAETGMLNQKKAMLEEAMKETDPDKRDELFGKVLMWDGKDPHTIEKSAIELKDIKESDKLLRDAMNGDQDAIAKLNFKKNLLSKGDTYENGIVTITDEEGNQVQKVGAIDTSTMQPLTAQARTPIKSKSNAEIEAEALERLGLKSKPDPESHNWSAANRIEAKKDLERFNREADAIRQKNQSDIVEFNSQSKSNGMLKAVPGKVSQTESLIHVDDPKLQEQLDVINKVITFKESGTQGVKADNPNSSAGGTMQLMPSTAAAYGAKKDANGDVPNSERDRVTPNYYADVYNNKAQGDASAYIAAGFGQDGLKVLVDKAQKEGGDWWDYLNDKSINPAYTKGIKDNMNGAGGIIFRSHMAQYLLENSGKEVPPEIQRFNEDHPLQNQSAKSTTGIKSMTRIN
jgi:hypothetical protein